MDILSLFGMIENQNTGKTGPVFFISDALSPFLNSESIPLSLVVVSGSYCVAVVLATLLCHCDRLVCQKYDRHNYIIPYLDPAFLRKPF